MAAWCDEQPCPPVVEAFATLSGDGRHYVAHVGIGLERLAAVEAANGPLRATEVVVLPGKVAFCTEAPIGCVRSLRCAESVSLLCWVAPTPEMPADASAFRVSFEALIQQQVIPQAEAMGQAWRAATGRAAYNAADDSSVVPFRVTARRGGAGSECISRQDLSRWLAEAWHDASHGAFIASAKGYELEVLLVWSAHFCCVELPAYNVLQCKGGGVLSVRPDRVAPALHGPIGWALAKLGQIEPGATVLDPLCGRGGTLLEAAVVQPLAARLIGCDRNDAQLEGALANARAAANVGRSGAPSIEWMAADCRRLPMRSGVVDVVLADLPFGKRHGRADGLYAALARECHRVLRVGGRAVLLTTCKREMAEAVAADETAWLGG